MLRQTHEVLFNRGGAVGRDDEARDIATHFFEGVGEASPRAVVADHAETGDIAFERAQVEANIGGSARLIDFTFHREHRHRRVRTEPFRVPVDVVIEHEVARDDDPLGAPAVEELNEFFRGSQHA